MRIKTERNNWKIAFWVLLGIFWIFSMYSMSFYYLVFSDSNVIRCSSESGGKFIMTTADLDMCYELEEYTSEGEQRVYDSRTNETICQGFCWIN